MTDAAVRAFRDQIDNRERAPAAIAFPELALPRSDLTAASPMAIDLYAEVAARVYWATA